MTEKTVWRVDPVFNTIDQDCPVVYGNIVCRAPSERSEESLDAWPERARLICAAPDLLAACELALEWTSSLREIASTGPLYWNTDVLPVMVAAVAKATGADKPSEYEFCEAEVATLTPTPDEPAPARKSFTVLTQTGERLFFTAESVEEYDGGLGFYVGPNMVGLVAAGRWTAYWLDANV